MHSHITVQPQPSDSEACVPEVSQTDTDVVTWSEYGRVISRASTRFDGRFSLKTFDYVHPGRLEQGEARFKKTYSVKVAYTQWGHASQPTVICIGGVVNTAMRFSYLADSLCRRYRVICMDWLGRGRAGWLATESDYSQDTYVEQLTQ